MRKISWLLGIAAVVSCARVMPPPGGERDTEPPRVVETDPLQNAQATQHAGTRRPVRIIFHETLSERSPRELVQVSPETGEVHAERDGREIRVRIEGGWHVGRVYRITVVPGVVDRLGNARTTTYELVFSTGGTILPNALGGIATDRITGRPAAGARVEAIAQADSTRYTSVTDSTGFFALSSLPAGTYDTRIYSDQNRNNQLDPREARDIRQYRIGERDTLAVEFALLAPDTTPARLLRAEIRDSAQVRLGFDDYMEATAPLSGIQVRAWQLPDSTPLGGGRLLTARQFQALRDSARPAQPATPVAQDTARLLPVNELTWVPASPLQPETRYRFQVTGYRNIHNLPNGGGSAVATSPRRVRTPPPLRPDSAAARDTTGVRRDTTRL
jgi:hypothetical protein